MRIRLAALTVFATLLFVAARGQAPEVQELAPGVYVLQGDRNDRKPANCTWVVFKDYVLVIDANFPWASREILPKIRSTTNKPIRFVFDTHYHNDHTYGNSIFADAGATIVCSDNCSAELATKGARGWENWNAEREGGHTLDGARLELPTLTFSDKIMFDDGTQRVEITQVGPGHSKGDAVAFLPKQGILITGDLCVSWEWGNYLGDPDGSGEGWVQALDRMIAWNPKTVIPGHGPPARSEVLAGQKAYLNDMLTQVRSGIRAGQTEETLAERINLGAHGSFAAYAPGNQAAIRAVYRQLTAGRNQ
jgi:glyoxylase-like metal-dependent hydrolase (beta-lactamase superfamily II)